MNPLLLFKEWHLKENEANDLPLPAACCLSTLGLDGYPNSRFVSLKEVNDESFVLTGPLNSRKGREMENCPKAALSFWWTATERQVRIQGDVSMIPDFDAENYFNERNQDSKIVSAIFEQGKEIQSVRYLEEYFLMRKRELGNEIIKRPAEWGGFFIKPKRIEFMEFRKSRLHERKLYQWVNDNWDVTLIQP